MNKQSNSVKSVSLLDIAVFITVCWIVVALLSSSLFRVHWFVPGDFSYSGAMYYHGIMIPVLILLYLLTIKILPLNIANGWAYSAGAILSVFFVGPGSIFNASKGISVPAVVQIVGMAMTDCLGVILVIAMVILVLKKDGKARKTGVAFWLLFSSIVAILIAAPLGHLAGWSIDIGIKSFPGSSALLNAINVSPDEFQDGLVGSHSHLIVAALLFGLTAVTAIFFQYQSYMNWKKRVGLLGLWVMLISLLMAIFIYVFSALAGWEPPVLFASGLNGIPFDDIILTAGEIGILLLLVGIFGSKSGIRQKSFEFFQNNIHLAIFTAWVFGFLGAVVPGIYIEFHEAFYGAGESPAVGALNDNIFIRAHLLYPFFLLPVILAVTLAVGCKYNHTTVLRPWLRLFIWVSILGMAAGLTGELLWFVTMADGLFIASMFIMGIALIAMMISLRPGTYVGGMHDKV